MATAKPVTFCKICMEAVPAKSVFRHANCRHTFCRSCLTQYITLKVLDKISTAKCPEENCKSMIELENCRAILPHDVYRKWKQVISCAKELEGEGFRCPYKECTAPLDINYIKFESPIPPKCRHCSRAFCGVCKVPWHTGKTCEEFQGLGTTGASREDLRLMVMAKEKNWKRCPFCEYFVERAHFWLLAHKMQVQQRILLRVWIKMELSS